MIQICVVYKYKGKNGAVGDGRTFYGCHHLPLSVGDILKMERQICEGEGVERVVVCNIIQLPDDGIGGEPHD